MQRKRQRDRENNFPQGLTSRKRRPASLKASFGVSKLPSTSTRRQLNTHTLTEDNEVPGASWDIVTADNQRDVLDLKISIPRMSRLADNPGQTEINIHNTSGGLILGNSTLALEKTKRLHTEFSATTSISRSKERKGNSCRVKSVSQPVLEQSSLFITKDQGTMISPARARLACTQAEHFENNERQSPLALDSQDVTDNQGEEKPISKIREPHTASSPTRAYVDSVVQTVEKGVEVGNLRGYCQNLRANQVPQPLAIELLLPTATLREMNNFPSNQLHYSQSVLLEPRNDYAIRPNSITAPTKWIPIQESHVFEQATPRLAQTPFDRKERMEPARGQGLRGNNPCAPEAETLSEFFRRVDGEVFKTEAQSTEIDMPLCYPNTSNERPENDDCFFAKKPVQQLTAHGWLRPADDLKTSGMLRYHELGHNQESFAADSYINVRHPTPRCTTSRVWESDWRPPRFI